jgi:diaminopimelate decarboxylase
VLELFPDSARLDGRDLVLGGVTASALADELGTPLVVYCEETLRERARALRQAADGGHVAFGT